MNQVLGADGGCAVPQVFHDNTLTDFQPDDLFVDLGMLILEGRVPDKSSKGRREGEHCPSLNWRSFHQCDKIKLECFRMKAVREYIKFLCDNAIPMSIDVMLVSECCYNNRDSIQIGAATEGGCASDQAAGGFEQKCHLLEQWIVQTLPKRLQNGHSQPQLLMQAVRSFLYFSQLSAWLNSSLGQAPHNVVYRVSAPGEVFGANFDCKPEMHVFPPLNISKSSCIQVSVASHPRQAVIPQIPCSRNIHFPSKQSQAHDLPDSEKSVRPKQTIRSSVSTPNASLLEKCNPSFSNKSSQEEGAYCHESHERLVLEEEKQLQDKKELLRQNLYIDLTARDPQQSSHIPSPYPQQFLPFPGMQKLSEMRKRRAELQKTKQWIRDSEEKFFIPETWTSTLSDLEMKYSNLKLDEIPSTECLSVDDPITLKTSEKCLDKRTPKDLISSPERENDPFNDDNAEKEVFQLHNLAGSFEGSEEGDDDEAGIMFSADHADPFSGFSNQYSSPPRSREHRGRTVSDSITCSLDFRNEMRTCYKHDPPDYNSLEIRKKMETSSQSLDAISVMESPHLSAIHRTISDQGSDFSSARGYPMTDPMELSSFVKSLKKEATLSHLNAPSEKQTHLPQGGTPSTAVSPKESSLLRNVLSKKPGMEDSGPKINFNNSSYYPEEDWRLESQHLLTRQAQSAQPSSIPKPKSLRRSLDNSGSYIFNPRTGLPINSSPAMLRKAKTSADVLSLLQPVSPLKSSPSCNNLERPITPLSQTSRILSTSAPAATSCLLGNFEESVLNGRLEPLGMLEGFTAEIGASGSFCPKHVTFPVSVFFFSVADEDAPSSYYGHINLESLGKRGYRIPSSGTIQVTLFNPNKTVVKMFVMRYNFADMPPNCQTFARQRIFYMPSNANPNDDCEKQLRYLMHLRFQSTKSGKIYLHTDIRMIFARHCPDLESSLGTFELRSFTEVPSNPRFSPKK